MSDFVFNVAKGKIRYYAELPGANDALVWVPIETTGLEADATLVDYHDLGSLLAASNNEQTTLGRQVATGVTPTEDDSNDRLDITAANPSWSGAGGNGISKLVLCYDPDTTTGTDADLIPLAAFDWVVATPTGTVSATISAPGMLRAS